MIIISKKNLKILFRYLVILFLILTIFFALIYTSSNCYEFPVAHSFDGAKWFNPYPDSLPAERNLANFHAHSRRWCGLVNGFGSEEEILNLYKTLHYDLTCISNYDKFGSSNGAIHTYEHGSNFQKVHQLVIGGSAITWYDFPIWQTTHHKQFILDKLRDDNPDAFLVMNHPAMRHSYTNDEIRLLNGFDAMEALNGNYTSVPLWDSALTYGKPLFIIGDDDSHNYTDVKDVGRCATILIGSIESREKILNTLKRGNFYAVDIGYRAGEKMMDHVTTIDNIPRLLKLNIIHDSLYSIKFSKSGMIKLIGQQGKILLQGGDTNSLSYILKDSDHYVRAMAKFNDSTAIYTNPVMRTTDGLKPTSASSVVLVGKTWIYRSFMMLFIIFLLIVFYKTI